VVNSNVTSTIYKQKNTTATMYLHITQLLRDIGILINENYGGYKHYVKYYVHQNSLKDHCRTPGVNPAYHNIIS